MKASLVTLLLAAGLAALKADVPNHSIDERGVHLKGVGPDNPIIYDNDWWYDVFDNNYLWAQASRGEFLRVMTNPELFP